MHRPTGGIGASSIIYLSGILYISILRGCAKTVKVVSMWRVNTVLLCLEKQTTARRFWLRCIDISEKKIVFFIQAILVASLGGGGDNLRILTAATAVQCPVSVMADHLS